MTAAKRTFLPADIAPGIFSCERSVALQVGNVCLSLLVDASQTDARHGVEIRVLERRDQQAWVELPAPPLAGPQRLVVDAALVRWV